MTMEKIFASLAGLALLGAGAGVAAQERALLLNVPTEQQVTEADVAAETARIPPAARGTYLAQPANVATIASNIYTRRLLAEEAMSAGLDASPTVQAALRIAREKVLSAVRMEQVEQQAQPATAALETFARTQYAANPARFKTGDEVRVRHILLAGTDANTETGAEKLLSELKAGADFAEAARSTSADPGSAKQGGELGFIARGRTVPAFEQAAFALAQSGDLSPLVKTNFGYHIIQLEERKPGRQQTFEEVRTQLMEEARAKILEDARLAKYRSLTGSIKVNEQAIEALAAQYR